MSIIITPPAAPAVPMALVRDHLRLGDDDTELALVGQYLAAATAAVEGYLSRALITRTVEYDFDAWPCHGFRLPPFQSVASITYVDATGADQLLDPSAYRAAGGRGVIAAVSGWPEARHQAGAVRVQLVIGYGDDWNAVPDAIRAAILMMTGQLYEFREPVVAGVSVSEVPLTIKWLLDPYRRMVV